jgi:tRNA-uridine 2-sulfurtransferase
VAEGITLFPPSFEPWAGKDPDNSAAVLMSGGVDSSVTAMLLKRAGWRVLGITMKIPVSERCIQPRLCCGADAAVVCHGLGLPHYFLDTREVFRQHVIEPFQEAYRSGRTPNPCADCNTFLKFTRAWDFIRENFGIRFLATGHYAEVLPSGLYRAQDRARDQSYFLYGLPRERLIDLVLPLGRMAKTQVRDLARAMGPAVARKPDSMELCFAGEGNYRNALADRGGNVPGPILDTKGNTIGKHAGIAFHTVGQRRGLRVAAGKALYVLRILPAENAVVLGTRAESYRRDVRAEHINVLVPERLVPEAELFGKIRSYGDPHPCRILAAAAGRMSVRFDTPQFAPAPGQRLVLYDATDRVVAGGTIVHAD